MTKKYHLGKIVERHFSNGYAKFVHDGDCNIYAADRPFCGCGLLHVLQRLDYPFVNILYPKFDYDLHLQHTGKKLVKKRSKTPEEILLEEIFGPIVPPTITELKMEYDEMKKALLVVFPKKMVFSSGYARLERWLKNSIINRVR